MRKNEEGVQNVVCRLAPLSHQNLFPADCAEHRGYFRENQRDLREIKLQLLNCKSSEGPEDLLGSSFFR